MSYFFSTQLYSKTPIETLEPRLSRYLVWFGDCVLDLLKTVLGKNSFDKQRHEKIKISDRGIVSKFHDVR